MSAERYAGLIRIGCVVCMVFGLIACSQESSQRSPLDPYSVSGSVGDGPIVDAVIVVKDANGKAILTSRSDAFANYTLSIPADTALPVTIHVAGGTDLVTGRAADFELVALVESAGDHTINVSPLTTLAVKAAQCSDDLSEQNLNQIWQGIEADVDLGLDPAALPNPMTDTITESNVATAILAQ